MKTLFLVLFFILLAVQLTYAYQGIPPKKLSTHSCRLYVYDSDQAPTNPQDQALGVFSLEGDDKEAIIDGLKKKYNRAKTDEEQHYVIYCREIQYILGQWN